MLYTMGNLTNIALQAAEMAYAPYSNFKVGAAIELQSGEIIVGANQENSSYPLCLCAERVAMARAWDRIIGGDKVIRMAVMSPSTDKIVSPCGACRQVMAEVVKIQGDDFMVEMANDQIVSVKELLPLAFEL